jgi:hypothetical protein
VCVTKKWEEVRNLIVQNLMFLKHSRIICELWRYCPLSSILPFWPLLHLFEYLFLFVKNHYVPYNLRYVNKSLFKPILLFLCFIWDTQKYLVKSVDSRRVTWLLFGNIRERLLYMIYHLFERERYLDCIFWSYLVLTEKRFTWMLIFDLIHKTQEFQFEYNFFIP